MGTISGPAGCVCHFVWRGRLFLIIMMMIFISILIQYIIVENIHYGDYWWWWFFLWWWWWWWWWWLIFRCAHTHILEKHPAGCGIARVGASTCWKKWQPFQCFVAFWSAKNVPKKCHFSWILQPLQHKFRTFFALPLSLIIVHVDLTD